MSDESGAEAGSTAEVPVGGKEETGKPDFVPDHFWNKDSNEVELEKVFSSYNEMGTKIREKTETVRETVKAELESDKLSNRPESADKYDVRVPDKIQEQFQEGQNFEFSDNDPMLSFWKEFSYNQGFSQEVFEEGVSAYIESAFAQAPVYEEELEKLGEHGRERAVNAHKWAKQNLSEDTYGVLAQMAEKAEGVMAVEEIMKKTGEPAFSPTGLVEGSDRPSLDELRKMQADPRYWDTNKMDKEFIRKVDAGYEKLVS